MRKPDRPKSGVIFRCAIYTRKSSDDGLEQEFNSLDAQREACEAYVTSQRHAGWIALPEMYDDGGLSGGTIERPALQRLLSDIKAGKVQIIVVYKVPWGVDSDQFWGQTEVANPLNLEATNATRSPLAEF
ncbi:MAG TPA: recombinase family protein [Stellaceae bacterium]|nr:recombinase family protein [Stellaceae bacterium]